MSQCTSHETYSLCLLFVFYMVGTVLSSLCAFAQELFIIPHFAEEKLRLRGFEILKLISHRTWILALNLEPLHHKKSWTRC